MNTESSSECAQSVIRQRTSASGCACATKVVLSSNEEILAFMLQPSDRCTCSSTLVNLRIVVPRYFAFVYCGFLSRVDRGYQQEDVLVYDMIFFIFIVLQTNQ